MASSLAVSNGNGHSTKETGVLDPIYPLWLRLQRGQEKVIRWGMYVNDEKFKRRLRKQNGHEHRCSIELLTLCSLIKIRPHASLDELLITRCVGNHDVPEGILKIDKAAPKKTDLDDLQEYLVFEKHFKPLGEEIWAEAQQCYLLQFCLTNPPCFPVDARKVMEHLGLCRRWEALFFDGIQRLDYLYYAYECWRERDVSTLIEEVTANQFHKLEDIAKEFGAFGRAVWTPECREFFATYMTEKTR